MRRRYGRDRHEEDFDYMPSRGRRGYSEDVEDIRRLLNNHQLMSDVNILVSDYKKQIEKIDKKIVQAIKYPLKELIEHVYIALVDNGYDKADISAHSILISIQASTVNIGKNLRVLHNSSSVGNLQKVVESPEDIIREAEKTNNIYAGDTVIIDNLISKIDRALR